MRPILTLTSLAVITIPALAHPGAHDEITRWNTASEHFLGSPSHVMLLLVAAGGGLVAFAMNRSRAVKVKDRKSVV